MRTISAAAASGNHVVHAILPPKLAPLLRERPDITLEFGARYMLRDSMADRFDAGAIAAGAKAAGMGHVVLTAKHHEGFALWDTALSDYSSPATR